MSRDWLPRVTVASVVEKDGKFLMVEEDIYGEKILNQPAGHLEQGETLYKRLSEKHWRKPVGTSASII